MAQKDIGKDKPQKDQKVIPLFGNSNKGKPSPTQKKTEAQHTAPSRSNKTTSEQKVDENKTTIETINKETADKPRIAAADNHGENSSTGSDKGMSFSDIMKRNAENKDRLRKERLKANQKVIRTHRLKH